MPWHRSFVILLLLHAWIYVQQLTFTRHMSWFCPCYARHVHTTRTISLCQQIWEEPTFMPRMTAGERVGQKALFSSQNHGWDHAGLFLCPSRGWESFPESPCQCKFHHNILKAFKEEKSNPVAQWVLHHNVSACWKPLVPFICPICQICLCLTSFSFWKLNSRWRKDDEKMPFWHSGGVRMILKWSMVLDVLKEQDA